MGDPINIFDSRGNLLIGEKIEDDEKSGLNLGPRLMLVAALGAGFFTIGGTISTTTTVTVSTSVLHANSIFSEQGVNRRFDFSPDAEMGINSSKQLDISFMKPDHGEYIYTNGKMNMLHSENVTITFIDSTLTALPFSEPVQQGSNLPESMEGTFMDNRFFDVMGERLYLTGYIVFGAATVLLLLLWGVKVIPFEVGLVGSVMSIVVVALLSGMKLLFGRFSRWY